MEKYTKGFSELLIIGIVFIAPFISLSEVYGASRDPNDKTALVECEDPLEGYTVDISINLNIRLPFAET